jgi:5'-nucleotidase
MAKRPLILLTNDDGIHAPGLRVLWEFARQLGDVEVVAPDTERSAVGHGVTILKDMTCHRIESDGQFWGYGLEGLPADCVKLGVTELFERKPDLVISGINPGANLGNNILYSGTVAAAREAAMQGVPAIAISVRRGPYPGDDPEAGPRFENAGRFVLELAPKVLEHGLPPGVILNVNVPNIPEKEIGEVIISRQGHTRFVDFMEPSDALDGRGWQMFNNVGKALLRSEPHLEENDDVVLGRGNISITPLQFDLTCEGFRNDLAGWF